MTSPRPISTLPSQEKSSPQRVSLEEVRRSYSPADNRPPLTPPGFTPPTSEDMLKSRERAINMARK